MTTPFDPSRYLTLVSGQEYLEVKWRLAWFRAEHPDGIIVTELVTHADSEAVFRAEVHTMTRRDPETGEVKPDAGSATGWGSEDAKGFGDYLEKAETKALGRALAALGYGTQFCNDFAGLPAERAPRERAEQRSDDRRDDQPRREYQRGGTRQGGGQNATDPQMGTIYYEQKNRDWTDRDMGDAAYDVIGTRDLGRKGEPKITKDQASKLIQALKDPNHPINR